MSPARSTASLRPLAPPPPGAPRLAPGLVPRPRLLRALAAARELPLVLLAAPAGFGKTTLLAEWAARDGRRFSWIRPSELSGPGAAARVIALHAGADPVVIALDDAQRAPAAAVDELAELAGRLPAGTTLAVATRRRPGPAASRLRAHRLALALGPAELSMTRLECSLLLAAAGARLDAADVAQLAARTHGWPAALAMAGDALAHPSGTAADWHGGSDPLVAAYVRTELLAGLRDDRLAFLRRTSIADVLTPALCDAILDRADAARMLEALAAAELLLEPLDDGAYRCHPLVRELLRADLERLEPARVGGLHRRAASHHRRADRPEDAARHAVASGDAAYAGRVLFALGPAEAAAGRPAALRDWLRPFGARALATHPELAMAAAALHLAEGSRDDALRWTAAADRAAARVGRGAKRTAALALLRACAGSTGLAAMAADAERAAALMAPGQPWPALATLLGGVGRHLGGDRPGAEAQLARAARPETGGLAIVRALAHAQLSLLTAETGAWERAGDHAARAREALAELSAPLPAVAVVHAAIAAVAAHSGDAGEARRAAAAAHPLLAADAGLPPWLAVEAQVWLARADIRLSDAAAARARLARAARLLPAVPDAPVLAEWLHDGWERADAFAAGETGELPALTMAELRVLRFLPSHLSFREIGDRLHVSANTVKTQALSAYRKLDVGCRSEAVARGRAVGLIDG